MNFTNSTITELRGLLKKAEREVASARLVAESDRKTAEESEKKLAEEESSYSQLLELMASMGIHHE